MKESHPYTEGLTGFCAEAGDAVRSEKLKTHQGKSTGYELCQARLCVCTQMQLCHEDLRKRRSRRSVNWMRHTKQSCWQIVKKELANTGR